MKWREIHGALVIDARELQRAYLDLTTAHVHDRPASSGLLVQRRLPAGLRHCTDYHRVAGNNAYPTSSQLVWVM